MPGPIDDATRAAIDADLRAGTGDSRAAIARRHHVSTRTVQRRADALGLADPWNTRDVRAATAAATDRRRALRSTLADELLTVEVPRLRERLATADTWRKTVVVAGPDGGHVDRVTEDDAMIARGMRELHTALGIAVDKTIAIDRHDDRDDGAGAGEVLDKLFSGLDAAYKVLQHQDQHAAEPEQP